MHSSCFIILGVLAAAAGLVNAADLNTVNPPDEDARGPVVVANMTAAVSTDGVQAPGYHFTSSSPGPGFGQTGWIAPQTSTGVTLFRKEVRLGEAPEGVQSWITATTPYRLYINGILADRGTADSGRDFTGKTSGLWFYNNRDLTPLFHTGRNSIAVEGLGGGSALLFRAQVRLGGGRTLTIGSDDTWRTAPGDYLANNGWLFDGNKEPTGWHLPGFDDSAWPPCKAAQGTKDLLTPSILPPCMEVRYPVMSIVRPTGGVQVPEKPFQDGHTIRITSDGSFAVRFDRIMAAYCGIKVRGGAGAHIELQPHEVNAPGASNQASSLVLRDGVQTFESPGFGSLDTINVIVSHVTTPVEIMDVSAVFTSQPVEYKGSFQCSDDYLNKVWKSCRWATQICMQTWHLDSPQHQEPISDYGDYLIEDRVGFNAFGPDLPLARQDLFKWAHVMKASDYRTFHTSYTLLWLQALLQYYDYTGDRSIAELMPYVHELMERFAGYRGKNGLISEAPNYMFMDWVTIEGFTAHHPPAVIGQGYMTAFYYRALKDAERLARLMGDDTRAEGYARLRQETAAAYNRELWNAEKGLYRDGKPFQTTVPPNDWMPADKNIETFSAQNNVLAVLYNLAPVDRQQTIIKNVMAQQPWNVRPYFMHFVLDAIAHAGLFDQYGTVWLRKWHIVPETQTFYEMGDGGDLSHGWIATPLIQMSEHILGVYLVPPGFALVDIRPSVGDLSWAKGSVPTLHGSIDVSWVRARDDLTLSVKTPPGTQAAITFPATSPNATLSLNNKIVWSRGHAGRVAGTSMIFRDDHTINLTIEPGAYTLVGRNLGLPPLPQKTTAPVSSGPVETKTSPDSGAAFEMDVSKDSLVALGRDTCTSVVDSGVGHAGGGSIDSIRNGTTLNGTGGPDTQDDGKTFRGYGAGSSITFTLNTATHPSGYDLTKILTFAGHSDSRASQNYSVSVAFAADPTRFVALVPHAFAACSGGSSEIVIRNPRGGSITGPGDLKAAKLAAVRFDFQDGSVENGPGLGFNVYREIQILGSPSSNQTSRRNQI